MTLVLSEESKDYIVVVIIRFAKFEYVKGHMVVHSIPKTLKCQYCHLKFRIKRYLNQHSRIHIDFTCDFCDKHFTSERTLRVSFVAYATNCCQQ